MRSHGKGSLSATTQVKVLSPEIILVALGQGFHFLGTNIRTHVKYINIPRNNELDICPLICYVQNKRTLDKSEHIHGQNQQKY